MFELIQSIHSVEVEFESGSYYCTGTCTRIDRETFTWHGMAWHASTVMHGREYASLSFCVNQSKTYMISLPCFECRTYYSTCGRLDEVLFYPYKIN